MAREQVIHKAGEPLPANLAPALRSIRREAPEFWDKLEKLGFQFYQQPSGFDDGIICAWKVEHQAKKSTMQHQAGRQLRRRAEPGSERDGCALQSDDL